MNRVKGIIGILMIIMMTLFIGCPNNDGKSEESGSGSSTGLKAGDGTPPEEGYLRVHYQTTQFKAGDETTLSLWVWGDVVEESSGWPNGFIFTHVDDFGLYYDLQLKADASSVGMLVVDTTLGDSGKTNQFQFLFVQKYNEIWGKTDFKKPYINKECTAEPAGLTSASITNSTTIKLKMSGISDLQPSQFTVKDASGNAITVTAATNEALTIVSTDYSTKSPYTVEFDDGSGIKDTVNASIDDSLMDSELAYDGDDLGWHNGTAKVWAPLASSVKLLVYDTIADAESDYKLGEPSKATPANMTKGEKGVWSGSVAADKYYMYYITNGSETNMVCDIYATVCSPDSIAAKAVELNGGWDGEASYINPFGNNGTEQKLYSEAVIFEMHIRDWSRAFKANSTGKFDDIKDALGTNGNGAFGQHLKDLGVTHVQILPMFDYAQKNSDQNYNWGYNPYQYNVPEGRYVNNHDQDGMNAVNQMRNMIKAFHDAGIAVNMDVVYNHTNATGTGSLFDMTVPKYYYRLTNAGAYSNGSGCGNETASNHAMYRKFMIDSLSHWVRDYHINGFRFDLMGLHESDTMAEIYTELSKFDPNIMVYGEPWAGGIASVVSGAGKAGKVDNAGYGAFDDDFRNAIKGSEYPSYSNGQVQKDFYDRKINAGLTGASTTRNDTGVKGLSIHYVECHDNYTLADKLAISMNKGEDALSWKSYDSFTSDEQTLLRKQNKLAAAYVFLSKGTPFINGGQEFMRTKKGNPDSYSADLKGGIRWTNEAGQYNIDDVNTIDLSFKTKYEDVYNVYKGLIALRRANSDFTSQSSATAKTVSEGFTKFTTGNFLVYFNATDTDQSADTTGYTKVIDVTRGTPTESTTLPTKVPATDFVILKK